MGCEQSRHPRGHARPQTSIAPRAETSVMRSPTRGYLTDHASRQHARADHPGPSMNEEAGHSPINECPASPCPLDKHDTHISPGPDRARQRPWHDLHTAPGRRALYLDHFHPGPEHLDRVRRPPRKRPRGPGLTLSTSPEARTANCMQGSPEGHGGTLPRCAKRAPASITCTPGQLIGTVRFSALSHFRWWRGSSTVGSWFRTSDDGAWSMRACLSRWFSPGCRPW